MARTILESTQTEGITFTTGFAGPHALIVTGHSSGTTKVQLRAPDGTTWIDADHSGDTTWTFTQSAQGVGYLVPGTVYRVTTTTAGATATLIQLDSDKYSGTPANDPITGILDAQ